MKSTITNLGALALLLFSYTSMAQVSHGGQPLGWQQELAEVSFLRTAELDMPTIQAEDAENDQYKEFAYRFGIERSVSIDPMNDGSWDHIGNRKVWRMGINCPNATAISVRFNTFDIPSDARIFIYDAEQTHYIGSFTSENRQANGMLATSLVYSEHIIVQFELSDKHSISDFNLSLDQIVHGYRGFHSEFEALKGIDRGPFGSSGACNININCPEGDDWQVESKSVAIIVSGGSGVCSGALVNNTNNDGHPYFLTADHCLGGVGNWVFYFNHESASCNGSSGPTNQSVSGATVVASNGGSDFGLLEINNGNAIPANFNVEFAGWDNSDSEAAVSGATGIHHPGGDVKKICHETDAPYHANQGGAAVWYIDEWEEGVTEGGSSGSPLFNQDHRIIGQLYGGWAACAGNVNNGEPDWYGRFGVSWDGNSASTRLRDWLDPGNTGATTLDGYPTGFQLLALDAASNGLTGVEEGQAFCQTSVDITPVFNLRNNGENTLTTATINWTVDGVPQTAYNWSGTLASGQNEDIPFAQQTFGTGAHSISFSIATVNGSADMDPSNNDLAVNFTVVSGGEMTVSLLTDDYANETSWEIEDENGTVVASGDGYSNATQYDLSNCLADGCYTFTIYDSYGDGICCGYGFGEYQLLDPFGQVITSGGEFGDEESYDFCLPFVVPPPVAAFTASATDICTPTTVTFTNNSTPTSGVTYAWTFEGGSPSTSSDQHPTVSYSGTGDFDVSLTVTNSEGDDTQSYTDYISANESPSASATGTDENLWTGGNNGSASATASGGTPPYSYSWSPGGATTADINNLSAGTYTVTVTDDEGCTATASYTVGNNVGIEESAASHFRILPNPSSGSTEIRFGENASINGDIVVRDVSGRMVFSSALTNASIVQLDLSRFESGTYLITISSETFVATERLVVK